jgi:hypothetical protein
VQANQPGIAEVTTVQLIIEEIVAFVPRALGWLTLKLVTLGRYRGFGKDDLLLEGGIGLAAIATMYLVFYGW